MPERRRFFAFARQTFISFLEARPNPRTSRIISRGVLEIYVDGFPGDKRNLGSLFEQKTSLRFQHFVPGFIVFRHDEEDEILEVTFFVAGNGIPAEVFRRRGNAREVEVGGNGRRRDCERKNPFVIFHISTGSGMRCFPAKSDMGAPMDTRYHPCCSKSYRDGPRRYVFPYFCFSGNQEQLDRSCRSDGDEGEIEQAGGDSFMCHGAQPDSRPYEGNAQEAR